MRSTDEEYAARLVFKRNVHQALEEAHRQLREVYDAEICAFSVLRQNNAVIKSRYHGPDYQYSYWLYGEDRIYRQKLKPKA